MAAGIMAVIAGLCLLAMVIYPMGTAPLRENQKRGWAEWRNEFSFTLKFYNPMVILYEGTMGWDRLDETIIRLLFGLAGLFVILAGLGMVCVGGYLLAIA